MLSPSAISLGLIQNVPTRWVLAFSPVFLHCLPNAPKYCPLGGGYVYTFEICVKRPFQKFMG